MAPSAVLGQYDVYQSGSNFQNLTTGSTVLSITAYLYRLHRVLDKYQVMERSAVLFPLNSADFWI